MDIYAHFAYTVLSFTMFCKPDIIIQETFFKCFLKFQKINCDRLHRFLLRKIVVITVVEYSFIIGVVG